MKNIFLISIFLFVSISATKYLDKFDVIDLENKNEFIFMNRIKSIVKDWNKEYYCVNLFDGTFFICEPHQCIMKIIKNNKSEFIEIDKSMYKIVKEKFEELKKLNID